MALEDKSILLILLVTVAFWLILISNCSSAYKLLDTIRTLKKENIYLQRRLDNLTWALRDLKHLILDHSRSPGREYDPEYIHAWREWLQQGISADTHQMLEQAFCLPNRNGAAQPIFITHVLLFLLPPLICFSPMLL